MSQDGHHPSPPTVSRIMEFRIVRGSSRPGLVNIQLEVKSWMRRKILLGNSSRSLPCLKFGSSLGRRKMEGRKEKGNNLVFWLKRIICMENEGIFLNMYSSNSNFLSYRWFWKILKISEDILEFDSKGARKCIEECFIVLPNAREREDMAKIHCLSISAVYNAIQFNDRDLKAQRKLPSARFVSYCRWKQWPIVD